MQIFENFNKIGNCPICKTNKSGQTILIPIDGSEHEGIIEGVQVHLECLNLRCSAPRGEEDNTMILYQIVEIE